MTRAAHNRRRSQEIMREASSSHKVAVRLDQQFVRRRLRSYYGYETRGINFARLKFDNGAIAIDPFGNLRRVAQ